MAVFNCETVIARALDSVLAQTSTDWELVAVDDCSTDASVAIIEHYREEEPRIRLIRRTINGGPSAARNLGLDVARGNFIAILDADDAWLPERLEHLISIADSIKYDFVADNQILYDDALSRPVGVAATFPHAICALTAEDLFRSEHESGSFQLSLLKPLLSVDFIRQHKLRYAESLRFAEDMRFYAELLILGARAAVTNEAMYIYTTPVGKISRVRAKTSKTDNRADVKIGIADELLFKYRANMSSSLLREVTAYRARSCQQFHSQRISELRQKRDYRRLGALALEHPLLSLRYAFKSRIFDKLSKKGSQVASGQHSFSLAAINE